MFSSIISLFKNITKAKYNKEKKETKKKVKQEEIKILKQLKNKLAGVAHIKAKEAESVKDSEKKAKKLKTQVFLLNLLQTFIEFLEFTFGSIITIVILLLFCIALVFIIVWIALNGLLHIDMSLGNGDIFTGKKDEDCIQGTQSYVQNNFQIPSQLSGTLTEQQKNIAICISLYNDILTGKYGNIENIFEAKGFGETLKKVSTQEAIALIMGKMSVENGFKFPGSSDILNIPCNTKKDGYDDAWLGLEADKGIFKGKYEYTIAGKGNYTLYTQEFVNAYTAVYNYDSSKDTSGQNPSQSLNNYVPYGIATQMGVMAMKYGGLTKFKNLLDTDFVSIASEFGINENLDKLRTYIEIFMTCSAYHGRTSDMDEPSIRFWCALWACTSDVDAERGFHRITLNEKTYDYYTYGGECFGYTSYPGTYDGKSTTITNFTYKADSSVKGRISINGTVLDKPLIKYVSDYCDSKGLSSSFAPVINDLNGRAYVKRLETAVLNQNYVYGLISYLAGMKAMSDVGVAAPIVSGGSIEDCKCYEGTTSVNTSNVSGGNTIVVPTSVAQTGLIKDFTNYVYFGDVKGWAYNQGEVWDLWVSKGRKYDSAKDIATIDGHYLIAVRPKFGSAGDGLLVELEDGSFFTAVIGDIKGSDAQDDWGHVYSGEVSLIEWEAYGTSASSTAGVNINLGDWEGKKITQITNTGSYLQNQNIFSGSSQENKGQSTVKFENFLFIGDSHTVQLNNNINLESKGHFVMAAGGASQSQFIGTSTGKKQIGMTGTYKNVSLSDYDKSKIKGVIVSLGSNARTSTGKMKEFLDEIVAYFDVPIFVQRVFPLGPGYSNYQSATQDVEKFNAEIKSYCDSNSELTYIDALDGLVGTDGNLINGADDGLHLTYGSDAVKVRQMWYDNIKSAVEGSSISGSDYLSTQIECIANETMGENHTIDYENGVNTLKNFLAIAMKPVGECMYSWGGGRDEYIYAKGVSPRWKEFYLEQLPKGSYNFKAHCPYPSPSASSNADGLDCSGFVGWCIVNNRETIGSKVYYTVGAASEGNYLSGKGFGQIVPARSAEFSYLPGDVYYNSGHTWICIGPSKHGGCVFVHASPDGVQINGFGGGEKTAYEYMSKYWPDFLIFAKNKCKADSSYQTSYDQFTWYILSEQDTSGKGLRDPEGFRSKTAEEILEYLFNPPTSSYSSVGTGNFINTKGQPQGIWNTKDGQKTTMDLINSMQVGQAWGGVSAGNMNQAFINRVKNFVPYMGDAVHAKDGNPTCANTDMAKRVLTETKFKVPYYHQGSTSEESWARLKSGTSYNSTSDSTFYMDGCHIYSFAYALSATQQRLINPPEALVIGWYGGFWSDGMGGDSNINNLKKNLNLNVKTMQDGKLLGKADVDSVLDKNGVVIVYLTKPFSSGNYHWVVITERVKDNGVDKYKIWTSTKISQVFQLYTFDELYNKRVGSNWIRMGVMP